MNNKLFYFIILILLITMVFMANRMFKNQSAAAQVASKDNIELTMYRGEGCNCCVKWADYLETEGFTVKDKLVDDLIDFKVKQGVSSELASCHTAIVDGYVVEGHVPAADIRRLVNDRPQATGIAVPGMPMGSPGMEGFRRDSYQVILFDGDGNRSVYAHY